MLYEVITGLGEVVRERPRRRALDEPAQRARDVVGVDEPQGGAGVGGQQDRPAVPSYNFV